MDKICFIKEEILPVTKSQCRLHDNTYFVNDRFLKCKESITKEAQAFAIGLYILRELGDEVAEDQYISRGQDSPGEEAIKIKPAPSSVELVLSKEIAKEYPSIFIHSKDGEQIWTEIGNPVCFCWDVPGLTPNTEYLLKICTTNGEVMNDPWTGLSCAREFWTTRLLVRPSLLHVLWCPAEKLATVTVAPTNAPDIELGLLLNQASFDPIQHFTECNSESHTRKRVECAGDGQLSFAYRLKDSDRLTSMGVCLPLSSLVSNMPSITSCEFYSGSGFQFRTSSLLPTEAFLIVEGYEEVPRFLSFTRCHETDGKFFADCRTPLPSVEVDHLHVRVGIQQNQHSRSGDIILYTCSIPFMVAVQPLEDNQRDGVLDSPGSNAIAGEEAAFSGGSDSSMNQNDDDTSWVKQDEVEDDDDDDSIVDEILASFQQDLSTVADEDNCGDDDKNADPVDRVEFNGKLFELHQCYIFGDEIVKIVELGSEWKTAVCAIYVKFRNTFAYVKFRNTFAGRGINRGDGSFMLFGERKRRPLQNFGRETSEPSIRMIYSEDSKKCGFSYENTKKQGSTATKVPEGQMASYLELFAGLGGMSLGFSKFFKVSYLVEMNQMAASNLKQLHSEENVFNEDVNMFIEKCRQGVPGYPKQNDVIGNCPPCQAFSLANRNGGCNDERNRSLLFAQAAAAEVSQPNIVVMENVPGLLRKGRNVAQVQKLVRLFLDMDYQCRLQVLNSAEFGTAQNRRRVFIFFAKRGWKLPETPKGDFGPNGTRPVRTAKDAIHDLEQVAPTYGSGIVEVGNGVTFNHNQTTTPASTETVEANAPAKTITRSKNWKHYNGKRMLSVRELARLFDIPDSLQIFGSETQQRNMIGNSVPVRLAEAVAKVVAETYVVANNQTVSRENDDGEEESIEASIPENIAVYVTPPSPGSSDSEVSRRKERVMAAFRRKKRQRSVCDGFES